MLNRMISAATSRRSFSDREHRAFSVSNLIDQLASDTRGYESEMIQDVTARAGQSFNPQRPIIPWSLLATRDMSASGTSGSQYLTDTAALAPADILRPWSVTMRSGLTVVDGLRSNIVIPRVTTAATPEWLASELDTLSGTQPVLGQVSMTPKICGTLTTFTKQLASQQQQLEAFLRMHLLATIGKAIDQAVIAGTGAEGQPQGIVGTTGVDTESGTSLAWAGIVAMQSAVSTNGSEPSALVTTPAVRALLQAREKAAGSGLVWDGATVGSIPAYASAACPAATLVIGDFAQAVLGIWGSGPEVAIDAFTGWASGSISLRVLLSVDTALLHPASFSVSTSIT